MATTILTNTGMREFSETFLRNSLGSIAIDAAIAEYWRLPNGFGNLYISTVRVVLYALTGAYVAPAPAYDGFGIYVVASEQVTPQDIIGNGRFVNTSRNATEAVLEVWVNPVRRILLQQGERILVEGPILAGAGVTASMEMQVKGTRFQSN